MAGNKASFAAGDWAQAERRLSNALMGLWRRFRPLLMGRLRVLEQAVTALCAGTLGSRLRRQAEWEAHKLAGSVGLFGLAEGTRLARQIEGILQGAEVLDQAKARLLTQLVAALRQQLTGQPAGFM